MRGREAQGSELTPVSCPWPQKVAEPHEEHRRGTTPFLWASGITSTPTSAPPRPSFPGQRLPIHAAHAGYEAPSTGASITPEPDQADCILPYTPTSHPAPTGPGSV